MSRKLDYGANTDSTLLPMHQKCRTQLDKCNIFIVEYYYSVFTVLNDMWYKMVNKRMYVISCCLRMRMVHRLINRLTGVI